MAQHRANPAAGQRPAAGAGAASASFSPYLASYAELMTSPRRTAAGSGERRREQAKPSTIQITGHEDRKHEDRKHEDRKHEDRKKVTAG